MTPGYTNWRPRWVSYVFGGLTHFFRHLLRAKIRKTAILASFGPYIFRFKAFLSIPKPQKTVKHVANEFCGSHLVRRASHRTHIWDLGPFWAILAVFSTLWTNQGSYGVPETFVRLVWESSRRFGHSYLIWPGSCEMPLLEIESLILDTNLTRRHTRLLVESPVEPSKIHFGSYFVNTTALPTCWPQEGGGINTLNIIFRSPAVLGRTGSEKRRNFLWRHWYFIYILYLLSQQYKTRLSPNILPFGCLRQIPAPTYDTMCLFTTR